MHTTKTEVNLIGRLQKRPCFVHAAKQGKKWTSTGIIVQVVPNELGHVRFGITITKKIYKQAVKRNRIRRRLKAVACDVLSSISLKSDYDIVLIGRHDTLMCPYADLIKDFKWCLRRLECCL